MYRGNCYCERCVAATLSAVQQSAQLFDIASIAPKHTLTYRKMHLFLSIPAYCACLRKSNVIGYAGLIASVNNVTGPGVCP